MYKRASKKFVCLVGVTLSVVPIFSLAQESNQQIKMLQEIQALRTELAELRDMVELQQYKLNKMQGSVQTSNRPYQSARSPQFGVEQGVYSSANQLEQPLAPNAQNGQSVNPNYGAPTNVPGSFEQNSTVDTYQPYSQGSNLNQAQDGSVVIEDRVINQNGTNSALGSQFGSTPVEERDIGQVNPYSSQQQSDTGFLAIPSNQRAINAQQAPANNAQQAPANNAQQAPANIQPSMTLSQNGTQAIPAQSRPGTNLNPLYQPPSQNQQNSFSAQQASNQNSTMSNQNSNAIPTLLAEKDYYQQGFDMLKQSKHTEAVNVFKQQISSYPQGDLTDDAHYWIAESMYVNRDLDNAKQYFKTIIDSFGQSPRLPDAMLKTAYIEQEQGNKIEARILLQEIIQYHPRSNAAISAKNRLTELN